MCGCGGVSGSYSAFSSATLSCSSPNASPPSGTIITPRSSALRKAETLLDLRDGLDLLAAERENHRTIRSMFWQAETEGLAQAKLQAALAQLFGNLGLVNIHFRSGSGQSVPDLPGVWRIQIRMDTNYRPGLEPRILHALATHPKKLSVDRLDLKRHSKNEAYLVLIVSSYFVGVTTEKIN